MKNDFIIRREKGKEDKKNNLTLAKKKACSFPWIESFYIWKQAYMSNTLVVGLPFSYMLLWSNSSAHEISPTFTIKIGSCHGEFPELKGWMRWTVESLHSTHFFPTVGWIRSPASQCKIITGFRNPLCIFKNDVRTSQTAIPL